jgi:aryl-alcohol dehydrogenase-like predicted oxidoreductase
MLTLILLTFYSQNESSERFIGEWAEARGIRDQLFIATKVGILLKVVAVKS